MINDERVIKHADAHLLTADAVLYYEFISTIPLRSISLRLLRESISSRLLSRIGATREEREIA